MKLVVLVLLALFASQAVGLASRAAESQCADTCGEEEAGNDHSEQDEDCPPDCADCLCCGMHRVLVTNTVLDLRVPVSEWSMWTTLTAPGSVEPQEILHVPRRLIA